MQKIQMFDEFGKLIELFGRDTEGGTVSMEELSKEYLEVSGRSEDLFANNMDARLKEAETGVLATPSQTNKGSFGRPTIKNAQRKDVGAIA